MTARIDYEMISRDQAMLAFLVQRDGPLPPRGLAHSAMGRCRYTDLYKDRRCPWCEAEARRTEREQAAPPQTA